jgi:uncharacterized cofD-like protein
LSRPFGELRPGGPRVVAIGGGHGLAQTLRAVRTYAGRVTAVVSVADDGGSSGRLREELGIPAPGDLRKCAGALLPDGSPLGAALEHRFATGGLEGHAFGNLLIATLVETTGGFVEGVEESCRLLGTVGRVLPATSGPVTLRADSGDGEVRGQVRIQELGGIARVDLLPADAKAPSAVIEELESADQVVIGPGSLYTSVLAACVVPGIREVLSEPVKEPRRRVYVANLREQAPETSGLDVAAHVQALLRHGIEVGTVLTDPRAMPLGDLAVAAPGVSVRRVVLGAEGFVSHDPLRLGAALAAIWAE